MLWLLALALASGIDHPPLRRALEKLRLWHRCDSQACCDAAKHRPLRCGWYGQCRCPGGYLPWDRCGAGCEYVGPTPDAPSPDKPSPDKPSPDKPSPDSKPGTDPKPGPRPDAGAEVGAEVCRSCYTSAGACAPLPAHVLGFRYEAADGELCAACAEAGLCTTAIEEHWGGPSGLAESFGMEVRVKLPGWEVCDGEVHSDPSPTSSVLQMGMLYLGVDFAFHPQRCRLSVSRWDEAGREWTLAHGDQVLHVTESAAGAAAAQFTGCSRPGFGGVWTCDGGISAPGGFCGGSPVETEVPTLVAVAGHMKAVRTAWALRRDDQSLLVYGSTTATVPADGPLAPEAVRAVVPAIPDDPRARQLASVLLRRSDCQVPVTTTPIGIEEASFRPRVLTATVVYRETPAEHAREAELKDLLARHVGQVRREVDPEGLARA